MASCFETSVPLNPINELVLNVFGDNYFPPYYTEYQPASKQELTDEPLLQMQLPGGGKIKPTGNDSYQTISDYVSEISGVLGTVFGFFGPLFIILDVIRAIIDMVCALFNPEPLIATVVEFFITVVPPLIALYPPLSTILHAINVSKVVASICASLIASIVPTIDKIVANASTLGPLLAERNFTAIDAVNVKICTLLSYFENQISAFAPLGFVLEILDLFMSLSSRFFCAQDSKCCDSSNCPPIIVNPPSGVGVITRSVARFTLKDFFDNIFESVATPIAAISDFIDNLVNNFITPIEGWTNDLIANAITPIEDALDSVFDTISSILYLVNAPLFGALDGLITALGGDPGDSNSLTSNFNFDVPPLDIPDLNTNLELLLETPETWEEVVFVQEVSNIGLYKDDTVPVYGSNALLKDPVASANASGRSSEVEIGDEYTKADMYSLLKYIVEPEKIPASQDDEDPATLRVVMTRVRKANGDADNTTVTRRITFGDTITNLSSSLFNINNLMTELTVRSEDFEVGDVVEYSIVPDQIALLSLNLIGLGCQDDIANAAAGTYELINADIGSYAGPAITGLDSVFDKVGRNFPQPPYAALQEGLSNQTDNPEDSQAEYMNDVLQSYLDDVTDFYDGMLCAGASRVASDFEVSKNFVVADGSDSATITLQVNDLGGNNLLLGKIPTSSASAEFQTTVGTIGPVVFDSALGAYKATITSDEAGVAEITGAFLVNGSVCMTPAEFDGFVVTDKVLEVTFAPEGGLFPKRRKGRKYRQSRGGRRR